MTMGHIQESDDWVENANREARKQGDEHFDNIRASLAAGNKLPLDELAWYIAHAEAKYFHVGGETPVMWRNKSKQTIYTFENVSLRINDSSTNPVYLFVEYSPVENMDVRFSREANEFLEKFEPVRKTTVWEKIDTPAVRAPGALA